MQVLRTYDTWIVVPCVDMCNNVIYTSLVVGSVSGHFERSLPYTGECALAVAVAVAVADP